MLDWLGDIGGLLDALYFIGYIFISPLATYARNSKLLSTLFRYRGTDESLFARQFSSLKLNYITKSFKSKTYNAEDLIEDIKKDFQKYKPIKRIGFWPQKIFCRNNYSKMINKAQSKLDKELDLRKFIYRQRLQTTAILGLLNGR